MKRIVILLSALLLLTIPAMAQTTTPALPTQTFTLSGKVGTTFAGGFNILDTDAVVKVALNTNLFLRQDNDLYMLAATSTDPAQSAGSLGTAFIVGPEYDLSSKIRPLFGTSALSGPNFHYSIGAEFGVMRSSSSQSLDGRVLFDWDWVPSSTNPTTVNLLEVYYNYGKLPVGTDPATNMPTYKNNQFGIRIGITY